MMKLLAFLILSLLFACQVTPTKTSTQTSIPGTPAIKSEFHQIVRKSPVVLDTRSPLDFSVSHPPGAINVNWQDFSRQERGQRGILIEDEMSIAGRLALWGINPSTPVVVVGIGTQGQGEEGRIAWMLKFMGIREVAIGDWSLLRSTIPRDENRPQNKPIWKPQIQSHWAADWEEFKTEVMSPPRPTSKARAAAVGVPSGALDRRNVVLDVTAFERKENALEKAYVPVKKIYWKDFVDDQGIPDPNVAAELEKHNITKNHTIYVISENGVSSGMVTFVLRGLGYQAKNFMGGYEYLYQVRR